MGAFVLEIEIRELIQANSNNLCLVDTGTYHNLKIDIFKTYKLHLGQLSLDCDIKPCEESSPCIYIPTVLMDKLLLYGNITLNIWRKNNDIFLGPVVGMFISRSIFRSCSIGIPKPLIIEHIKEAGSFSNCLGYCFCVNNVDLENDKIMGYIYIEKLNQWQLRWFPVPDVIYDRAVYLEMDEKDLAKDLRQELTLNPKIRFINPVGSLGKWPLYKKLSSYSEIKDYLPETILYKTFDDIFFMLNKHNIVFLKSSYGSMGKQVVSIEKACNNFKIEFYDKELKIYLTKDISELKKYIESFIKKKQALGRESFIVQQGISTIKYNGHNMIFRIDIVKNEYGKWETMRPYGIYSSGDSNITNFCIGGIQEHFKDIYPKLKDMHSNIALPTEEDIMAAVEKIATFIEKSFGTYGEIGIDIVIDENGKLWFIEGNSKPDKSRIPGFDNMEGIAPQALAIFKYAKYLAINRR